MTERIEEIFLRLLEKSPGIALIVLCILLVRCFLKKYPGKYSYFLWLALGIRLLWVAPLQLEIPVFLELPESSLISQTAEVRNDGSEKTIRTAEETVETQEPMAVSNKSDSGFSVGQPVDLTENEAEIGQKRLSLAAKIWASGVILFFLYFIVSYIRMKHRVRFAIKLRDNIYECDVAGTPFVMGIFKPEIYLPFGMSEEHQAFVICHEACHIKRRDYLVKLFAFLLLGVYWFHPCVWAGYILMCQDMEMSCDELAVGRLGMRSKQAYSAALLAFATQRRFMGNMLGFGEHNAAKRIKNVLAFSSTGKARRLTAGILCAVLIPVLGCEIISVPAKPAEEIAASPLAQELYEASAAYIGNVPGVSNILDILQENDIMPQDERTLELQTEKQPYGLIVHFKNEPEDAQALCEQMYNTGLLLWALVENLENVEWTYPEQEDGEEILVTYYFGKNELHNAYGELDNIKEYGKSPEKVEELMRMAGVAVKSVPELKNAQDTLTGINWSETKEIVAIQKSSYIEKTADTKDDEHPSHEEKSKQIAANAPGVAQDIIALLKGATPMSAPPELDENSTHIPITLFYGDGTKDTFCFFHVREKWYMKAQGNAVYEGGDFVENYMPVQYTETFNDSSDMEAREQAVKSGVEITELSDEILAIAKELDVLDERYYFALYAEQNMEFGESPENACELARGVMMNNMKIYRYAVEHGMEIPEEELKIRMENSKKLSESAVNYEEMKKKYAEAGLSFEEMDKKNDKAGLLNKITYTIEWLYQSKAYEFRHGTNRIGDYECENVDDYWRYFLMQEVLPEAQNYDLSDYERTLDEAQDYCLEHIGK